MRTAILGLVAAVTLPAGASVAAETAVAATCPPVKAFTMNTDHLDGYRVILGPDGDSKVEPLRIDAKQIPLLKTGKILGMLELPTAPTRGVEIVVGPPDVDLPMHAAPYKEMFVLLAGTLTFKTRTFSAEMQPGSVLFFEDVGAKTGHGGHIGPCGYVSLSIAP